MTYAVFKFHINCNADEWIKRLSLLLLTPESKLYGFDAWNAEIKIRGMIAKPTEVLAGNLLCSEAKEHTVSIVKFPKVLSTDKHLLTFGDEYIGCFTKVLKKNEMLSRIELFEKLKNNESLIDHFEANINSINTCFKVGLTEVKIEKLKSLQEAYLKPLEKWIKLRNKNLKKSIAQLTKFLLRSF
jgi:hypothetical protein